MAKKTTKGGKGKSSAKTKEHQREKIPKYDLSKKEWNKLNTGEKEQFLRKFRTLDNGTGWNPLEAALFYLVLKKYGCGNWDSVSYFLPHQNTAQFNTFCQKLFGQQSLYAFSGLRVDPYENFLEGIDTLGLRKNGVRVHEGIPLSTAEKKAVKAKWKEKAHVLTYDLPVVEDRGRNYTKLWWQMELTSNLIANEAKKRNIEDQLDTDRDMGPKHHEKVDHKKWMDEPYDWPKPTVWNVDREFQAQKRQDNLWPLIRMVEDEDWYKADQALHWSFLEGKIFRDKEFQKNLKNEDDVPDLQLTGIDPERMRTRCRVKKIPGKFEMEVEKENCSGVLPDVSEKKDTSKHAKKDNLKEVPYLKSKWAGVYWERKIQRWRPRLFVNYKRMSGGSFAREIDAARAVNKMCREHGQPLLNPEADLAVVQSGHMYVEPSTEGFGHVSGWTCEQLCQYLRETGLEDELVKKFEEKQVNGKKAYNFAMEEAEAMFDGDRAALDRYDRAMMAASRKFGFLPR